MQMQRTSFIKLIRMAFTAFLVLASLGARAAHAQEEEPLPPPADQASGVRVAPDETDGWRQAARAALFPARFTLKWLVFKPVGWGLYTYDRYQLGERFKAIFFNDEGTFGLYPVALFETGFGLNVGARLIVRDVFGEGESLRLRASYGGAYRQLYSATASSGSLFGPSFRVALSGAFEARPGEAFYGIGRDAPGQKTLYSSDSAWGQVELRGGPVDGLSFGTSLTLTGTSFGSPEGSDHAASEDAFTAMELPGYESGLYQLYGEMDLTWSHLRHAGPHISLAAPSSGVRVEGYLGAAEGLGDDPSHYLRHGVDASAYIDLYKGDRTLVLRSLVEGVSGDEQAIPFTNLPTLGGELLRGHPRGRFRDRWLTLATAEYRYPVNEGMMGAFFVDAGSVWHSLGDIDGDSLGDSEIGFGIGLQLHNLRAYRGRVDLAFSPEGDMLVSLQLDPVNQTLSRKERK
jgi:hypothetical protein